MKKLISVFVLLLTYNLSYAEWSSPGEIINFTFGSEEGQVGIEYGDTEDIFPAMIRVDEYGRIIIPDGTNNRLYVCSNNNIDGYFESYSGAPYLSSDRILLKIAADNYIILNYNGEVLKKFKGPVWTNKIFGTIDAYYIYEWKEKAYYKYSQEGVFIEKFKEKPLELGAIKRQRSGSGDRKYKTLLKYPDHTYEIYSRQPFKKYSRDRLKNLYRIESFAEKKGGEYINAYRVFKYEFCDNKEIIFEMPKSEYEQKPPKSANYPTWKRVPIIEYGEPIISNAGDLYCWARTKTEYRILKWTWQGDPDAPQSLTVNPSATGILLGWKSPAQNVDEITGYEILRSAQVCGKYKALDTVEKNVFQYEDKSFKEKVTLYYQVRAIKSSGYSGYSNKVAGLSPGGR